MALLERELRALPKVELHRHLDGSVRFETIQELSKLHNIDLGAKSRDELWAKAKIETPLSSLQEVLDSFWTTQKVMCSYDAIKRVAFENVEDCYNDGLKLVELRFAPTFIAEGKTLGNDEIIEGIIDGVQAGMDKYEIQVGLIHIVPRSLSFEKNVQATDDIFRYRKSNHKGADRLFGFDLADMEDKFDPVDFKSMVDKARLEGMGITIHSGEDTTADHIVKTLDALCPTRIGHGIKSIDSEDLLKRIIENDIHLEVCPTSNWLTKCVSTIDEHPLPQLFRRGVSVSLNSDDPHLMNIDLTHEYLIAQQYYGFTPLEFHKMNREALRASFLPQEIRDSIGKKFFN